MIMKSFLGAAISIAALAITAAQPAVVFENPQVRVFRTTGGPLTGIDHGPGVIVPLDDKGGSTPGNAVWLNDVAVASPDRGAVVVVRVLPRQAEQRSETPPAAGSKPGEAPFTGMSFKPIFENDRLTLIRARMDVGAREGFHTHGSDTLVVHLSGGQIEDTANGKTVVNRWKPGDVEFESKGSSHSARNVGSAVDVVLVALKP
jgi:quercetin dioxygenase-like cupin family protein